MLRLILLLTWVVASSGSENRELPTFVDPVLYTKSIYASLKANCPNGLEKCECLNAVGKFSEGPFDPDDNPLQALITYVGCGPGKTVITLRPAMPYPYSIYFSRILLLQG